MNKYIAPNKYYRNQADVYQWIRKENNYSSEMKITLKRAGKPGLQQLENRILV